MTPAMAIAELHDIERSLAAVAATAERIWESPGWSFELMEEDYFGSS
jgi:hypothetical protein